MCKFSSSGILSRMKYLGVRQEMLASCMMVNCKACYFYTSKDILQKKRVVRLVSVRDKR